MNEQDDSLYFAHRTIRDFITGPPSHPELAHFHVDVKAADIHAGEVCLTYLHLDSFQGTLEHKEKALVFRPKDISSMVLQRGGRKAALVHRFLSRNRPEHDSENSLS